MIDESSRLAALLPALRAAPWLALDTEADSLHAYPEKLCLIQVSIPGLDELIDPLALPDLAGLWMVLQGHELVLHGADYDLRMLRRSFGFVPDRMFDTMIAARLLGYPQFGLTDLVRVKLGVTLEKGPQKMDWARRPLTSRMAAYARNDTRYLQPLAESLREELLAKGRLSWLEETCRQLIGETSQPDAPDLETVWRVKGSDRLPPRALAVLRELWQWRETEAIAANKPPFFILSHDHLVSSAAHAALTDGAEMAIPLRLPARRRQPFEEAVRRGLAVIPGNYPRHLERRGRRLTRAEQLRCEKLRQHRDLRAVELGIDPTLIASRATLVALAHRDPADTSVLMDWQRGLLFQT